MKAVWIGKDKQVSFFDEPRPQCQEPDEVLLRLTYCTIGELETNLLQSRDPYFQGCVPGYELVGTIVAMGEVAKGAGFALGDCVTSTPVAFCGACPACLKGKESYCFRPQESAGGLREYVVRKVSQLYKVPPQFSMSEGCLIWTVAEALQAVERCHIEINYKVFIFGATFSAMVLSQLVKLRGAQTVVAIDTVGLRQEEMDLAKIDRILDFKDVGVAQREALREADFYGFDAVFSVTNNGDIPDKLKGYVSYSGTLCFLAFKKTNYTVVFKSNGMFSRGINLISSYLFDAKMDLASHLMERLEIDAFVTAEYPFEQALEAFVQLNNGSHKKIGIRF